MNSDQEYGENAKKLSMQRMKGVNICKHVLLSYLLVSLRKSRFQTSQKPIINKDIEDSIFTKLIANIEKCRRQQQLQVEPWNFHLKSAGGASLPKNNNLFCIK